MEFLWRRVVARTHERHGLQATAEFVQRGRVDAIVNWVGAVGKHLFRGQRRVGPFPLLHGYACATVGDLA